MYLLRAQLVVRVQRVVLVELVQRVLSWVVPVPLVVLAAPVDGYMVEA
jgi:hypothetical protein